MMRRRTWIIVVAIALLLLGGDLAYWQFAVSRLRSGLQTWTDARKAAGWDVALGPTASGGWPYAATVAVPNLTMRHSGRGMPGDVRWASASVTLSVPLYDPSTLSIALDGPQHIQAGAAQDMILTGDQIALQAGYLAQDTLPLTVRARGLRLEPAAGGWRVTVGLLSTDAAFTLAPSQPSDPAQPAATFSLSSEAIGLPTTVRWPLGPNISSLSMEGKLNGPMPAATDATVWAEAWREGGGSLEISHFASGWGPLGVTGGATLALDDQLQPMGSGTAHLVGFAEALDRLAAGGVLTKSAATAAKAVLSLLAGSGGGDDPPTVDVPLTLQYRTLSMRQVPLVRLPELDWPAR
jgi:Uncharacterized protein conserved in bacteria (DUF2125)